MKKNFCFIIINFFLSNSYAQDYSAYYQHIDSAKYFKRIHNYKLSDSLYALSFRDFRGFPDDYLNAVNVHYKFTHQLNKTYITQGFENGLLLRELYDELRTDSISYSKRELKKLHRKHRVRKSINVYPIARMLLRDAWARMRSKNVEKADSINALKMAKLLSTKPELFNRHKTGYIWSSMLNIIILHSQWKRTESLFNSWKDMVKKGYLDREPLYTLIDRNSLQYGYLFHIDSASNKIIGEENGNLPICPHYIFHSNLGQFYYYRRTINKNLLVPLNPTISTMQLNKLRHYLFLPSIELFLKTNPTLTICTEEEFCSSLPFALTQSK